MSGDERLRLGFERRFRIIGIDRDGNRFIFADGLDLLEANALHQTLLVQESWPRMLIVIESDRSFHGEQSSLEPFL